LQPYDEDQASAQAPPQPNWLRRPAAEAADRGTKAKCFSTGSKVSCAREASPTPATFTNKRTQETAACCRKIRSFSAQGPAAALAASYSDKGFIFISPMISLRQSIAWRVHIARRTGLRAAHAGINPLAGLLPKKGVSAVLCGRNDNYTPDFKERIDTCLSWAFANGLAEAVWVEWNPPVGAPLFAEQLTARFPRLRSYVVPMRFHEEICENPAFGLMEYHAKNVGIRRASTDWVCCTNADIIWGPDVFHWFSLLRKNVVYQAQRVDFRWTGEAVTIHLLKDPSRHLKRYRTDYIPIEGPGDFTLAHRTHWLMATGYDEALRKQKRWCDDRGIHQLLAVGGKLARIGTVFHMDHSNSTAHGATAKDGITFEAEEGVPYQNPEDWGLARAREKQIGDRIWLLE